MPADALKEVAEIAAQLQSSLIRLENFQKLTELQRDLIGIENLTGPGRVSWRSILEKLKKELDETSKHLKLLVSFSPKEFIREGCLYKLTKKGLQQRMFFLVGTLPDTGLHLQSCKMFFIVILFFIASSLTCSCTPAKA